MSSHTRGPSQALLECPLRLGPPVLSVRIFLPNRILGPSTATLTRPEAAGKFREKALVREMEKPARPPFQPTLPWDSRSFAETSHLQRVPTISVHVYKMGRH